MLYLKWMIVVTFFTTPLVAQKKATDEFTAIDKKVLEIPDSLTATTDGIAYYINAKFVSDIEKVRAVFIWIASAIEYDIENIFAINFYEQKEDKILKPLKTRKGICENFAALFNEICLKTGIPCYLIEGYTKQNGFADYIPHAWCAAYTDSAWNMYDPTWGSGFIYQGKFNKKINNSYFKVDPAVLIKSHMPFDPLWQFLYYPVTNQDFYDGNTEVNTKKNYFNYPDSIKKYQQQNEIVQLQETAIRVEKNGPKNFLIYNRLQHLKLEIEQEKQNKYNIAVFSYNDAVNGYNDYIRYWNKQFSPAATDAAIQGMLDTISYRLNAAGEKLNEIKDPSSGIALMIIQLNKSIKESENQITEENIWLKKYFATEPAKRKSLFFVKRITGL